ncbi:epimerase/aldolase protein [Bacillus sp. OxB-1]|uniref:class II aldolase/adducin family protein n=1 Tax=Bacillus sp. (strain OxB-1) TaxID=98228 RepID=UPI00058220C8|nr:class II aldolase/adducin family protein [Bacillus sp. OxB-1]BAQ09128.1 epimerase/aldolase protein [Bacillus sp. OxB-1]
MKAQAQLIYPERPVFDSIEKERQYRKERLASAFRLFSKFGFDNGVAGHITVRDPEFTDSYWVNQFGMHFSQVTASNLLLVNDYGEVVEGDGVVNGAALVIHSEVHKARPDVQAVAHTHSTYGMAWASLGRTLDPISQDACAFYEDHAVFGKYNGVVLDYDEGTRLGETLGDKKALILLNHGLLTVGQTVDEAAWWFISMERCCQAQLLAEAAGEPHVIDHETAIDTRDKVGSSQNGWYCYQPLWDRIKKEQPDFLD